MPAPFPQPRLGNPVNYQPAGFPLFFEKRKPRVITADPWAFYKQLTAKLPTEQKNVALAFITQAFDFFEAAKNPHVGSKPLLYYYAYLNIAKAALVIKKVNIPINCTHGISDPRINNRTRLQLTGQVVKIAKSTSDHKNVLPELIVALGGEASKERNIKVMDLLKKIPSVHRTYNMVTNTLPEFTPIKRIVLYRSKDDDEVWARIILDKNDKDVKSTINTLEKKHIFKKTFAKVVPTESTEYWYETSPEYGRMKGVDTAILNIANKFKKIGIFAILTHGGYKFYLPTFKVINIPQVAIAYAFIFYLGSITRYKPDVFDKILSGSYSWLVAEYLATQPMQFLYMLASHLAGVDVVRPHAVDH